MGDPERFILIIVLIFFSAAFSATESAFSYANKIRLKVKADDGNKRAKMALKLLEKFDKSIITLLILNNIVNILVSVISTVLVVGMMKNEVYGSIVATVVVTILVFIFGEVLPKNYASQNADKFCMMIAYPISMFIFLLTPITILYRGLIFVFKKIFKVTEEPAFTEDDFTNVIESIEEEGLIEEEESDIIQSAVDFGDKKVHEVITKREDMVAVDITKIKDETAIPFLPEKKYSRIPVYAHTIDNIIGVLHIRTYIKQVMVNKNYQVRKNLSKPYFVSPNMNLDDLFEGFRKKKTHIALVVDHENKIVGMVTMEDVLEKLVGDIDESEEVELNKGGSSL